MKAINKYFGFSLSMGYPNTYVLSKALAEDLLMKYQKKLPIVIVRPSMISVALNKPLLGYVEGLGTGLVGSIAGAMCGLLRTIYVEGDAPMKVTAVDFVANAIIVGIVKRSTFSSDEMLVYNCTDAETNGLTWAAGNKVLFEAILKYPAYEKLVWYPRLQLTSSVAWQKISLHMFQLAPAFVFDVVFKVMGRQPM